MDKPLEIEKETIDKNRDDLICYDELCKALERPKLTESDKESLLHLLHLMAELVNGDDYNDYTKDKIEDSVYWILS